MLFGGAFCDGFLDGFFKDSKMAKSHGPKMKRCGDPSERRTFGVGALERAGFLRVESTEDCARRLNGSDLTSRRKRETGGFFGL